MFGIPSTGTGPPNILGIEEHNCLSLSSSPLLPSHVSFFSPPPPIPLLEDLSLTKAEESQQSLPKPKPHCAICDAQCEQSAAYTEENFEDEELQGVILPKCSKCKKVPVSCLILNVWHHTTPYHSSLSSTLTGFIAYTDSSFCSSIAGKPWRYLLWGKIRVVARADERGLAPSATFNLSTATSCGAPQS